MSSAYQASQWHDLFFAASGAAAALTGLVFVAVSMHLSHLAKERHLRTGAGLTLFYLVLAFVVSMEVLIPSQSRKALGFEIIATLVVWISIWLRTAMAMRRDYGSLSDLARKRIPYSYASFALTFVGGVGLITHSMGGLFLVVPGIMSCMLIAVQNAWFFLTAIGLEEGSEEERVEQVLEDIESHVMSDELRGEK